MPQAIPLPPAPPSFPRPLQQTGFWFYTNLPSGPSLHREASCPPHLPSCPPLALFPYTSWPSLPLSFFTSILSLSPCHHAPLLSHSDSNLYMFLVLMVYHDLAFYHPMRLVVVYVYLYTYLYAVQLCVHVCVVEPEKERLLIC